MHGYVEAAKRFERYGRNVLIIGHDGGKIQIERADFLDLMKVIDDITNDEWTYCERHNCTHVRIKGCPSCDREKGH